MNDKLGTNRVGDTILCYAWGETDRPEVFLAKTVEEVKAFIVTEWIDDVNHPYVQEIIDQLAAHDWREEGEILYEFEIGGVSFKDVFTSCIIDAIKKLDDRPTQGKEMGDAAKNS